MYHSSSCHLKSSYQDDRLDLKSIYLKCSCLKSISQQALISKVAISGDIMNESISMTIPAYLAYLQPKGIS